MKKAEEIVRKKLERDDTLVDKDLFVQSLAEMKSLCFTFLYEIDENLLKLRKQMSLFFTKIEELLG